MEALAAGCSVLTSNIAGMPETCIGLAKQYGCIYNNKDAHIARFADELNKTIQEYRSGKFDPTLQVQIANKQFGWETRKNDWIEFDKQLWRNPYGN
jgi:glycosyltransferase involved in cell wall biosynthesis